MKEKLSYLLWGCLYVICVGLGTLQERPLPIQLLLGLFALLFYVPGVLLIVEGCKGKKKLLLQVRIISIVSLALTLGLMVANIASVYASAQVGDMLNQFYMLAAAPMHCLPYGFISIFCWACLLMGTFPRFWKT